MKKIIKTNFKIMIAFVIGAIVFGSVGVVSAYTLLSNHIEYEPKDSAWKVNNVSDALDSLYIAKTGENYSTEERVVGTWIDGKPIYQRTIDCGALPNSTEKSISHGIEDIDNVIFFWGITYRPSVGDWELLNWANPAGNQYSASVSVYKNNIKITTATNRNEFTNTYVTIQYTKTTDTATVTEG